MASFWLDSNNNRYYTDRAFTYNFKQYTRAGATEAKFTELGFTQVNVQTRPDDRFYVVSGPDNTGAYTYTARDLATLKEDYVRRAKLEGRNLLRKTDWLVVRLAEKTTPIPADVATFRDAVRTVADNNCTAINNCATVTELKALVTSPRTIEDPNAPGTFIDNPAALDAMPTEVSGYNY